MTFWILKLFFRYLTLSLIQQNEKWTKTVIFCVFWVYFSEAPNRRRNLRSGLRKMQSISHMIFYGQKLLFFHIWTFINFYLWTSAVLGHFVKVTKLEKWGKSPLFLNKVQNHTFFKFLKIILNVVILTPNSVDILYTP